MLEDTIIKAIKTHLPNAEITMTPINCSRPGYNIEVCCDSFRNQTLLQQHKRVTSALASLLDKQDLHAITIKTKF